MTHELCYPIFLYFNLSFIVYFNYFRESSFYVKDQRLTESAHRRCGRFQSDVRHVNNSTTVQQPFRIDVSMNQSKFHAVQINAQLVYVFNFISSLPCNIVREKREITKLLKQFQIICYLFKKIKHHSVTNDTKEK